MNKNNALKLAYLLFLTAFIIISCSKKTKPQTPKFIQKNINLSSGDDFIYEFSQQNYKNFPQIKKIFGDRLLNKISSHPIKIKLTATNDSLEIKNFTLKSDNFIFKIEKTEKDSLPYDIVAIKPILRGNNIFQILTDFGMKAQDIGLYAWEMGEYIDARSIKEGDTLSVEYSLDSLMTKHFKKLTYKPDNITIHEFYIQPDRKLKYHKVVLPYVLKKRFISGELTKENPNLDTAMKSLGIIPFIRQQVNNALQSQISFSTDARIGDKFEALIEEIYVNDKLQNRGKVYFAKYSGKRVGTKYAYRYSGEGEASAFTGMYDPFGRRLISNAVRTPLNNMHVTSPFGWRIHPIRGRRIFHHGIDLRAGYGINVYAVASGRVIKARNNGNGYGKEVRIRHRNGMITQYAHLSKIYVRYGRRVRKGQIIGRVGSTGLSTGPHLHFGVMKNGKWVNPLTNLKMVGANKLKGKRLEEFKRQIANYKNIIAKLKNGTAIIDTIRAN